MISKYKFQVLIIIIVSFFVSSCTEKVSSSINNFTCNINLDSSVLELYKIDTQTINISTKAPITNKGSISIDSNNSEYVYFTFNSNASTIKKDKKGFSYPARTFKIVNNYFYYGDDISLIDQCTDSSLVIYNELNQVSSNGLKVQWLHLRKK